MASPFKIEFLDHVALRVEDLGASVRWYQEVMGLTPYRLPEWGDYPVFMLSGKTGVALFPAGEERPPMDLNSKRPGIDHFAFQVTQKEYKKAKSWFEAIGIPFKEQDHHYFRSVYLKDPDGNTAELTTLAVEQNDFYRQ